MDNDLIASGSWDMTIKIWNIKTGECIRTLEGHNGYVRIVIKVGKDLIASGSSDKTIKIWNFNTGEFIKTLEGHKKDIFSLL